MKKFTGSYANTEKNFVIMNLNAKQSIENDVVYSIFSVIENILQRGNPTVPSIFLKNKLGILSESIFETPYYLISKKRVNWNNIKGDTQNSDYPAEIFFDELLEKYFGEYGYVRNLIIPEAEFSEIVGHSTAFDSQQVDFYIPQIKTVVEIDGSSHNSLMQSKKDLMRDKELKRNNITVLRIKTDDLRSESKTFIDMMSMILENIKSNELIKSYRIFSDDDIVRIKYDTVFRLEIALIECLKAGMVDKNQHTLKIDVKSQEINDIDKLLFFAYEDICNWYNAIAQLVKADYILPTLIIENSEDVDFCIDISLYERYTDTTVKYKNTVYIRSDYFCDNYYYKVSTAKMLQYNFLQDAEEKDAESLYFLLKNIFGFDKFNEGQLSIIKNVLERNDTIGILPTGGGKSLTYQFCALLQPGITVIIEPIISLIQDQKRSMDKIHFDRTGFIASSLKGDEKSDVLDKLGRGKYHMLWCSPERFQNKKFREAFVDFENDTPMSTAVIDEVHCLSEWGHDFRISYLALIGTIRQYCPDACLLGLTATASQAVLEDLKVEFDVDGSNIKALASMNREELLFKRIIADNPQDKLTYIMNIVNEHNEFYTNQDGTTKKKAGLIFCPTVNPTVNSKRFSSCNEVLNFISDKSPELRVSTYHGQLTPAIKETTQNKFMNGEFDLMVSTKAFGMGIDKDNVKYTIHCTMPQSVESFYQEAGRAGRESDKSVKSDCYIIYTPESSSLNDTIEKIFNLDTDIEERRELSENLNADLSTLMFFWNSNKKTVDAEYNMIRRILSCFYNNQFMINFKKYDPSLSDIQNALYRMYLLGIIDNWNIHYNSFDEGFVEVEYLGLNQNRMYKRLLSYIHKYDPEFQVERPSSRYRKYYKIMHTGTKIIPQLFKCLIEWSNDNILYNKLQSTFTMMQWMNPEISDEQFRNNIVEYLKFSEVTVLFDNIVHNPLDYNIWFDTLKFNIFENDENNDCIINTYAAQNCLASLQRYLESYRNNTGLNYMSGILRIITGEFVGTEGQWRFSNSLNNIKENFDEIITNEILDKTFEFAKYLDIEAKDVLSKEIIEVFPDSINNVFNTLNDRYSLSLLLKDPVTKITHILKEIL